MEVFFFFNKDFCTCYLQELQDYSKNSINQKIYMYLIFLPCAQRDVHQEWQLISHFDTQNFKTSQNHRGEKRQKTSESLPTLFFFSPSYGVFFMISDTVTGRTSPSGNHYLQLVCIFWKLTFNVKQRKLIKTSCKTSAQFIFYTVSIRLPFT